MESGFSERLESGTLPGLRVGCIVSAALTCKPNPRAEILVAAGPMRGTRWSSSTGGFLTILTSWVDFERCDFEEDFGRSLFAVWWEEAEI